MVNVLLFVLLAWVVAQMEGVDRSKSTQSGRQSVKAPQAVRISLSVMVEQLFRRDYNNLGGTSSVNHAILQWVMLPIGPG